MTTSFFDRLLFSVLIVEVTVWLGEARYIALPSCCSGLSEHPIMCPSPIMTVFGLFNVEVLVFIAFFIDVFWVSEVLLILLG